MLACLLLLLFCFSSSPSSPFANPTRSPDLVTDSHSALKRTANQHLISELHQRDRANAKIMLMATYAYHLSQPHPVAASCGTEINTAQTSEDKKTSIHNSSFCHSLPKKPPRAKTLCNICMEFSGQTHQGQVFCGLQLMAGMTDWCLCSSVSVKTPTAPPSHPSTFTIPGQCFPKLASRVKHLYHISSRATLKEAYPGQHATASYKHL